jgi:hypothetical protein
LIVDEAHHASADSYTWIMEALEARYPELRVLGVTATPRGGAGKRLGLSHIFPHVSYTLSLADAIHLEVLSPLRALGFDLPVSFRDVGVRQGDYEPGEAGRILSAPNARDVVVQTWAREAQDDGVPRRTLAFAMTVEQAHAMAGAFSQAGYPAAAIDAYTPADDRRDLLAKFARGDLLVLTNCSVFNEGFDLPSIACVIPRPTPSDSVYLQMIGRGLRRHPGKLDALILDFQPADARDFIAAQDVLPPPDYLAAQAGEIRGEAPRGVGISPTGEIVDPTQVRRRLLNLLEVDPLAWYMQDDLATATVDAHHTVAVCIVGPRYHVHDLVEHAVVSAGMFDAWEDVVHYARRQMTPEGRGLALKARRWRQGPASDKQRDWLARLGLSAAGLTRGQAASRLTWEFARRALRRAGVR